MEKRKVEDILDMHGPVAYEIDHKKQRHQCVCPWCAKDIGKPKHIERWTYAQLYDWLFELTFEHMKTCPQRMATEMMVWTEDRRPPTSKQ